MSASYLAIVVTIFTFSSTLFGATRPLSSGLKSTNFAKVQKDAVQRDRHLAKRGQGKSSKTRTAKKYRYRLLPRKLNAQTRKWVNYYSKKDAQRFQRFLNRGSKYKTLIQAMLVEYGLPPELYYLGLLESGYVTGAVSHAGAVGTWQFMRPTGQEYGLHINNYVDERLDPIRSTMSAIKYLKELKRQTRDWKLALAAYNAGPGRVRRAIRRGGRNFWRLSRRRLLPRDTRNYIPQFLAMVHIGSHLQKYGFTEKPSTFHKGIHLVSVPSPVHLKDIGKLLKISVGQLKKLNPHLKKSITPPNKKSYDVWVPQGQALKLISKRSKLAKKVLRGLKVRSSRVVSRKRQRTLHRVRRGDTLSGIARRYRKTVSFLKTRNRLKSSRIRIGQKIFLTGVSRAKTPKRYSSRYKIRRGDSLIGIAKKFDTTVSHLRRMNKIRGNRILSGQYILVAKK